MLSSSHPKICEPLVTGVSPRPTDPRPRQETAKHAAHLWVPEIVLAAVTCCFAVRRIPA
jgi:hypothetical protein